MLDKDTYWGSNNGLATLIPTLLHFGLIGYPFVLPGFIKHRDIDLFIYSKFQIPHTLKKMYSLDMIGGNGYNTILPDRELFIRWMQANVFMPAMQFSYTPWDYNEEVSSPFSFKMYICIES